MEFGTFDTPDARHIGLDDVLELMRRAGAKRFFSKMLAPNDNSKNQPYFGHHLTDLAFIPTGHIEASETLSQKSRDPSRRIKYQAPVKLSWIGADGATYRAPHTKLIYYPQYPEVRFSGFLRGSRVRASRWMSPEQQGRALGRWLLLGVAEDESVYAFLATPGSCLAEELTQTDFIKTNGVFGEIAFAGRRPAADTRAALIDKLKEIHHMGWVDGCKLAADMQVEPYKARNGGGYTLEALLGISPNGVAEPDYMGWEVKQFGVRAFPAAGAKPTTLMTPEPDGGFYTTSGAVGFVQKFGYPDRSGIVDRMNFGGKHAAGVLCAATSLTLFVDGFDQESGRITEAAGVIGLISSDGSIAASWTFAKLMDHWKTKHSQAVYVPCMKKREANQYHYGSTIKLGIGTNFELFLAATAEGLVYYDPGIKLEGASSGSPRLKRRSQFRVNHKNIGHLYQSFELLDISG